MASPAGLAYTGARAAAVKRLKSASARVRLGSLSRRSASLGCGETASRFSARDPEMRQIGSCFARPDGIGRISISARGQSPLPGLLCLPLLLLRIAGALGRHSTLNQPPASFVFQAMCNRAKWLPRDALDLPEHLSCSVPSLLFFLHSRSHNSWTLSLASPQASK